MTDRIASAVTELVASVNELTDRHHADQRHIAALTVQVEQLREDEELLDHLLKWWLLRPTGPVSLVDEAKIDTLIRERIEAANGTS